MIQIFPKIQKNRKKGVTRKWTSFNGYPKSFDPLFSNFSPNNFWSTATNDSTMHDLNVDHFPDFCKKPLIITKVDQKSWNKPTVAKNHYGPIIMIHNLWITNPYGPWLMESELLYLRYSICLLHPFCGLIWDPYI